MPWESWPNLQYLTFKPITQNRIVSLRSGLQDMWPLIRPLFSYQTQHTYALITMFRPTPAYLDCCTLHNLEFFCCDTHCYYNFTVLCHMFRKAGIVFFITLAQVIFNVLVSARLTDYCSFPVRRLRPMQENIQLFITMVTFVSRFF